MKKQHGFNLIELIICLTIVSIMTAITLPQFSSYFLREQRLSAELSLIRIASALEKYYAINNTYDHATLASLGLKELAANHHYQFIIAKNDETDYLLTAIPQNSQKKDSLCATLSLDSTGKKSISGSGTVDSCWQ